MKGATILNIETSGDVCSICLSQEDNILGIQESRTPNIHAKNLVPYVDALLKGNNITSETLDAVSVSLGPGSYTGLRIGVSFAKAICYSWSVPLIGISTLEAMFYGVKSSIKEQDILFCPMIDARRMEVYTAVYDSYGNTLLKEQPMILSEGIFKDFNISKMIFFGSGAEKVKSIYQNVKVDKFQSSSTNLISLAKKKYNDKLFEDVAYFEPNYIKPFYSANQKASVILKDTL